EVRVDGLALEARVERGVPGEVERLDGAAEGIQGADQEPGGRGLAEERLHERPRVDQQSAGDLAVRVEVALEHGDAVALQLDLLDVGRVAVRAETGGQGEAGTQPGGDLRPEV